MANARKLPSGAWRVRVYDGMDADGKRVYKSFTDYDKHKAELAAKQYQVHHKDISRDAGNMTVGEAIDRYIKSKDGVLSPSTIRGYEIIKRNNLQGIKNTKLNKLTRQIAQEAINDESKEHSPKTVRNINGLLTAAIKAYCPDINITVTLPQKRKTTSTALDGAQITKLIQTATGTEMEVPVLLAVWLGMRSSEITALTWDDIDFKTSTINIRAAKVMNKNNEYVIKSTKTYSSTRKVAAAEYVMETLKKRKNTGLQVVRFDTVRLWKELRKITARAGLPDIRFHDLRHTNASVMLALNVPDKYAQERGGWATNATMKRIYQHTISEEKKSVDDSINGYFEKLVCHEMHHDDEEWLCRNGF